MRPLRIQTRRDYQQTLVSYLAREEVQAYTMAILSFFALAFFSVFAIRPTLISFFGIQKQIADATAVEEDLDKKINSLLKAQENYQLYQNQIALLGQAIPPGPEFPELVKRIEGIVNDNEATMSSFRTNEFSLLKEKKKDQPTEEGISSVNFTMTTEPTYTQGESIVKRLMNLRRIILLNTLGISSNVDDNNEVLVETTLDGSAYFISTEQQSL